MGFWLYSISKNEATYINTVAKNGTTTPYPYFRSISSDQPGTGSTSFGVFDENNVVEIGFNDDIVIPTNNGVIYLEVYSVTNGLVTGIESTHFWTVQTPYRLYVTKRGNNAVGHEFGSDTMATSWFVKENPDEYSMNTLQQHVNFIKDYLYDESGIYLTTIAGNGSGEELRSTFKGNAVMGVNGPQVTPHLDHNGFAWFSDLNPLFGGANVDANYSTTDISGIWNVDLSTGNYGGLTSVASTSILDQMTIVSNDEFSIDTGTGINFQGMESYSDDAYGGSGGNSDNVTEGDTPGTWSLDNDSIDTTPNSVSSANLGLYRVYIMNSGDVTSLSDVLYSNVTEIDENILKVFFDNPRDAIISITEYPSSLDISGAGFESASFPWITGSSPLSFHGFRVTSEYQQVDFGTITVSRYSGTFADYEPYTTAHLFIPYIGYVALKPSEIMCPVIDNQASDATISISGYIHLGSGEMTVNVISNATGVNNVIGTYSGTVGRQLPLSSNDYSQMYSSIIKTGSEAVGALIGFAAGGAIGAAAGHSIGSVAVKTVEPPVKDESGVGYYEYHPNWKPPAAVSNGGSIPSTVSEILPDSVNTILNMPSGDVERANFSTSPSGRLSSQKCYLIIEYPHLNIQKSQLGQSGQSLLGYATNVCGPLSGFSGYTELKSIRLNIPYATEGELNELYSILKGGFFIGY